jgi:biopolymer transport protein ExbD
MKFLDETEADDPILSVVNLIDVFLVVIAALLITVAKNPLLSPSPSRTSPSSPTRASPPWKSSRSAARRSKNTRPAARSARATARKAAWPTA